MKRTRLFWVIAIVLLLPVGMMQACGDDDDDDPAEGGNDDDDDSYEGVADGYPVVDTDQTDCFINDSVASCPGQGESLFGQDAQYSGFQPQYQDNGDGTVTDLVTGLMWQQDPGDKMTYDEAEAGANSFSLAGYDDWRLPTVKELYSLILFSGLDVSTEATEDTMIPFIDDTVFTFYYGDESIGDRLIDSQWVTSSVYEASVMNGQECFFGVNFADGRIKCYGTNDTKGFYLIHVRGDSDYGNNKFSDNSDGTIGDVATGLEWTQDDSGEGLDWEDALAYCEDLSLAGHDDWRLPNAKELQSLVDYSRSPDTTDSPAIDSIFNTTSITNEAGEKDYPFFWSSTTHESSNGHSQSAVYVSFGRALGYMNDEWIDVHGAGAQRSDPKSGDPGDYETGHGPQGDAVRIFNYARCVRDGEFEDTGVVDSDDDDDSADDDDISDDDHDDTGPPPEAQEACNGKNEGDICEVNTPEGDTISGTCEQIQDILACVPDQGPPE